MVNDKYLCVNELSAFNENVRDLFSAEYWQEQGKVIGKSGGRHTVWFVDGLGRQMVLRHYYRGGLPGKFIRDQFVFTGYENTRSFREYRLLELMHDSGLPVPAPVAAKVERNGLVYSADILIERIPESNDVFQLLKESPLPQDTWIAIGKTIRRFHDKKIWHADLNCHNILLTSDEQKVWLIDFDRCRVRDGKTWQAGNLLRLQRSLRKESRREPSFQFKESDWQYLMAGYQSVSSG